MNYPNYIVGSNPFKLGGPPLFFQRRLWDFDNSLVIVPSKQGFFYRLAQRRPLSLKENLVSDMLKEQADAAMLATYNLIPVTTIMATVNWDNPLLFEELRRRAPWRMGGAQKFTEMVEAQDRQEELAKAAAQDELTSYYAKDAWRYYNKQIGTRSQLWSPTVKSSASAQAQVHSLSIPKPQYTPQLQSGWGDTTIPVGKRRGRG